MPAHTHRPQRRGSTIIVVIVITAVLTVVAAAMLKRANQSVDDATAKRQYDTAVSCADGARELLLSQFRAYGVDLTQLTLNTVVGNRRYATGHYDSFGVKSVVSVDKSGVGGANGAAVDLANRAVRVSLGGAYYRVTVVCSDSSSATKQSEIEFLLRFGL